MRAICHREGLLSGCQLVSAAIPANKALKPILMNIKAVATDARCTLIATDQEVGIRLDVQGLTIQEPGEAILPAARLVSILREARDSELTIEADASACIIRGATLEFEMASEDPAQFPDFPHFTDEKYHEISAGSLREMIRRTVFATAEKAERFSMTGVAWEMDGDKIRLIATDGRRLALTEGLATATGGHTTKGQTPVVPTKAMSLLERNLADDPEASVKVCIRPNEVLFRTERAVIYSRLVEGRFPNWQAVMPKKPAVTISMPVAGFQAAVRQAAIMAESESPRVTFKFAKGRLTLIAQGATSGRSKIEMPIEYDGKPIDINFNPAYVVEMLKILPPESSVMLDLIDGANPALLRYEKDYSYLIMPLT
jgi:DNA polymerase III subunit beta